MQKGGNGDGVSHSDDDADPEVTAITRRLNRSGDTLGAINELEQLLIERTGQIPVISPELLSAHAARIERAEERRAEAAQASTSDAGESGTAIDWSIAPPQPLSPAPGFSPWVDPAAIAAALDTAPREFTDVSTKVFAVFSADRVEPAAREAAPEPEPEREPEPAPEREPAPEPAPPATLERVAPPEAEPAPTTEPEQDSASAATQTATPAVAPIAAAQHSVATVEPAPAPKRRRWPFGRR